MSWEVSTTPVAINTQIDGKKLKPTATLTFDSTKFSAEFMAKLEEVLYGKDAVTTGDTTSEAVAPRLPLPDEIIAMFNESVAVAG